MKGYTVANLAGLAIVFVIAAVVISIGAEITGSVRDNRCEDADGTWGYYSTSGAVYPVTGTYLGCCGTVNASAATDCDTWVSGQATINITLEGQEGLQTMGEWLPTLAIVIMAGVVIGILLTSFKFGGAGA